MEAYCNRNIDYSHLSEIIKLQKEVINLTQKLIEIVSQNLLGKKTYSFRDVENLSNKLKNEVINKLKQET